MEPQEQCASLRLSCSSTANRRRPTGRRRSSGCRCRALRQRLSKWLGLPISVDNDANCAALAESTLGAARGTRASITVTLGTGVGCG
ncbi:MAG: ROK family protein, partial [Candidatus Eisenbacteria bacterium]